MKVSVSKSKNSTIYYLSKTVRVGKKFTTKTIERIGSREEVLQKCGDMDPYAWCKQYAAQKAKEEREESKNALITFSAANQIEKDVQRTCNVGYLFLQSLYHKVGLDKICAKISANHNFEYDLNKILSMLVYTRVLYPSSKRSSLELAQKLLEAPDCELHQVYRALEILAKENDFIQSELYKNSEKVIKRNKSVLYYDCTNYFFEIEEEDDFRKYGKSKENRPNPIVQMGLFMDADGIPLSFSLFDGNMNEQPSLKPLEKKILSDFGLDKFVVCTDAGLSSTENRRFNNVNNRRFVTTQPLKKLKGYLKDFVLEDTGWQVEGDTKVYKISELNTNKDYDKIFYKKRWITVDDVEQQFIVTYSIKYREYLQKIRQRQIDRAEKLLQTPSKLKKKNPNDPKRFISQNHCTDEGEIADNTISFIDEKAIQNEAQFDGYYAVCTNLEDDVSTILRINQRRWEIEECFRILKTEFKARPVYLIRKDRITAHFQTCFIALVLYRLLEQKLESKYTCTQIIRTLRSMDMLIVPGEGYIPAYTRTDVTDALHTAFSFRTDYQIISQKNMKKIITQTKKAKT